MELLQTTEAHIGAIRQIVFAADGSLLVSGYDEFAVSVWQVNYGSYIKILQGDRKAYQTVISSDATMAAVSNDDRSIGIYHLPDGNPIGTLKGHHEPAGDLAFSPDGTMLASAGNDRRVMIWRLPDGGLVNTLICYYFIDGVAFSQDGMHVSSWESDGVVKLWRVSDGALLTTADFHTDIPDYVYFSPDKSMLFSGDYNQFNIWKVSDGSLLQQHEILAWSVSSLAFSSDGTLIAYGMSSASVKRISDWSTVWEGEIRPDVDFRSLDLSPDSTLLAGGTTEPLIRIIRISDGISITTMDGHEGHVESVAFSPDGALLASGSADDTVKIWRVSDGALMKTLTGHTDDVDAVRFTPDGKILASATRFSDEVFIWRVADGELLYSLNADDYGTYQGFAFSPDGSILALALKDGSVELRKVSDGTRLFSLVGHRSSVSNVTFSKDGTLLASGSSDGTIWIWGVR